MNKKQFTSAIRNMNYLDFIKNFPFESEDVRNHHIKVADDYFYLYSRKRKSLSYLNLLFMHSLKNSIREKVTLDLNYIKYQYKILQSKNITTATQFISITFSEDDTRLTKPFGYQDFLPLVNSFQKRSNNIEYFRKLSSKSPEDVSIALDVSLADYLDLEANPMKLTANQIIVLSLIFDCKPNDLLGFRAIHKIVSAELDSED